MCISFPCDHVLYFCLKACSYMCRRVSSCKCGYDPTLIVVPKVLCANADQHTRTSTNAGVWWYQQALRAVSAGRRLVCNGPTRMPYPLSTDCLLWKYTYLISMQVLIVFYDPTRISINIHVLIGCYDPPCISIPKQVLTVSYPGV